MNGRNLYTRKLYAVSLFLALLWFFLEGSFVFVMKLFLASLGFISDQIPSLGRYSVTPIEAALLLIVYGIARSTVQYLKVYLLEVDKQRYIKKLRIKIFKKIIHSNFTNKYDESVVLNLMSNEVVRSGDLVRLIHSFIHSTLTYIMLGVLAAYNAPREMLLGISLLVSFYPLVYFVNKRAGKLGEKATFQNNSFISSLTRGMLAIKTIKSYGKEKYVSEEFNEILERQQSVEVRFELLKSVKHILPTFIGVIFIAIIGLISTKYYKTESTSLITFFYVFFRFSQNISYSLTALSGITYLRPAYNRINDFLLKSSDYSVIDLCRDTSLIGKDLLLIKSIKAKTSEGDKEISCNLTLKKGDLFLLKGCSGIGKSLFLSEVVGLLKSDRYAYNKNISRESISYVGPSSISTTDLVINNLLYLNDVVEFEEIEKVLKITNVDFIEKRDMHKKINVDTLSTGQLMRLDIARALLRSPTILVLDESTSNFDIVLESQILRNIRTSYPDMLILLATHRSSLDDQASYIINMDKYDK